MVGSEEILNEENKLLGAACILFEVDQFSDTERTMELS